MDQESPASDVGYGMIYGRKGEEGERGNGASIWPDNSSSWPLSEQFPGENHSRYIYVFEGCVYTLYVLSGHLSVTLIRTFLDNTSGILWSIDVYCFKADKNPRYVFGYLSYE